jgi:hypothetical protein
LRNSPERWSGEICCTGRNSSANSRCNIVLLDNYGSLPIKFFEGAPDLVGGLAIGLLILVSGRVTICRPSLPWLGRTLISPKSKGNSNSLTGKSTSLEMTISLESAQPGY